MLLLCLMFQKQFNQKTYNYFFNFWEFSYFVKQKTQLWKLLVLYSLVCSLFTDSILCARNWAGYKGEQGMSRLIYMLIPRILTESCFLMLLHDLIKMAPNVGLGLNLLFSLERILENYWRKLTVYKTSAIKLLTAFFPPSKHKHFYSVFNELHIVYFNLSPTASQLPKH